MSTLSRVRTARCLLMGAVLLTSAPVGAQDTAVRLDDAFLAEWRDDNHNRRDDDDHYGLILNRLDVNGAAGDMTAHARVDTVKLIDAPTDSYRDFATLERLTVRYGLGELALTAGDFHRQLGRGIALSVRKVDDLGLDVALRGGRVAWAPEAGELDVFVGRTNSVNLDAVSQHYTEDPEDVVVGSSATVVALDPATLSVWGVQITNAFRPVPDQEFPDRSNTAGGSVELTDLGEVLTLYIEYDVQSVRDTDTVTTGQAVYSAVDAYLGDWSLLVEGLWLDEFRQQGSPNTALGSDFDYNQPPTLERIDQEVLNTTHVAGGRARLERSFLDGDLTAHVNGLYKLTDPGECAQVRQLHGFTGFEWLYQEGASRLSWSGGYRDESTDPVASDCAGATPDTRSIKTIAHAEIDWVQSISGPWSVHLTSNNELRTLEERDYRRGSTLLGVDVAQRGALTFEYGFDTQNQAPGVRNHFLAGIAAWHAIDWLTVRAVAGTQRGGIKCIAGVCRDFPEFAGARLELFGRTALTGG